MSDAWTGPLHIGTKEPLIVGREDDGSGMFYQACCQCRLIHLVRFRPAANDLHFFFEPPDPEIAASIEGARLKAEDDQLQLLLKRDASLKREILGWAEKVDKLCPCVDSDDTMCRSESPLDGRDSCGCDEWCDWPGHALATEMRKGVKE